MRDLHVNALRYRLQHSENVSYRDPPAVRFSLPAFKGELTDGVATISMLQHCSTIAEARSIVEPYLRAWELHDELLGRRDRIRFEYEDAELIDRDPPPPGATIHVAAVGKIVVVGEVVHAHVGRKAYPPRPDRFKVVPDVEVMWRRYLGFKNRQEPLLAMAYFCLTVVEAAAGSRRQAVKDYRIHIDVLRKLGELSSVRGDAGTARKRVRIDAPLSQNERAWIEAAVRRLIARVAEVAGGKDVDEITMDKLPSLTVS